MSDQLGPADFLRVGDWNIRCDRCGKKMKGSEAVQNWQGYYTCRPCWEPRQPQDFVRGIQEYPTPPFIRNPADEFLPFADSIVLEDDGELIPFIVPGEDIEYILLETGTWILTES